MSCNEKQFNFLPLMAGLLRLFSATSPNIMLEVYLASLSNPADRRAVPNPSEKNRTLSIIDERQRELDFETPTIAKHRRRTRILEEEHRKRKQLIAPILGMPDDVLVEILDLALRGARRRIWRFSQVCRHWRQLCRSYACLWSYVEVDLTLYCQHASLVSKWRERARATNQTIDLRLRLEQFGTLKGILEGGLKYITHLRLSIPAFAIARPKFDLPPALPCLSRLALNIDGFDYSLGYIEAKVYITSLCHRFFTRRQTRRRGSGARFHLEFYNLAFSKLPRVINCVHTVVLRKCTFTGPSQILQFLEAARFTIRYLEYTHCWIRSSETPPHTRPLTIPFLSTLKHCASSSTYQFPILPILSCPALKVLTISEEEATLCTVVQYPAIQELRLVHRLFMDASHVGCPLVRDSRQLDTLTISQLTPISPPDLSFLVRHYKRVNLDVYTGSLRRFRFHSLRVLGSVEQFEAGLREVANDFARRGRDIEFRWIQGDCGIGL